MRRRSWAIALLGSVALHGVVLGLFAWVVSQAPRRAVFGRIPVQIVAGEGRSGGSQAPAAKVGTASSAGLGVSSLPARGSAPTSPATPSTSEVAPRTPPEASHPRWGEPGTVAEWWSGRSVVDYVAACRRGEAPQDSILEPMKTPEEIALARTTDQINDLAWRMHGVWTLEKFEQRLRESFPLMH